MCKLFLGRVKKNIYLRTALIQVAWAAVRVETVTGEHCLRI